MNGSESFEETIKEEEDEGREGGGNERFVTLPSFRYEEELEDDQEEEEKEKEEEDMNGRDPRLDAILGAVIESANESKRGKREGGGGGERGGGEREGGGGGEKSSFSVDEIVDIVGFGPFQVRLLLITGLCWMVQSMEVMLLVFLPVVIGCEEEEEEGGGGGGDGGEFVLSKTQIVLLGISVFVGMMVGEAFWGSLSDKKGRRIGFLATAVFGVVFGLASAFSPNFLVLIFCRGLVGFGTGGSNVAYTLFAEFLPTKRRGLWLLLINLFWTAGAMILVLFVMLIQNWRWLLIITTIPEVLMLCLYYYLPESPRYYLISGESDKATEVLQEMCDFNGVEKPGPVMAVMDSERGKVRELMGPKMWRATVLLWCIWFLNTFIYYGLSMIVPVLFHQLNDGTRCTANPSTPDNESTGCSSFTQEDYLDTILTLLGELPGILILALVIDFLGRKPSQGIGLFLVSVLFFALTTCWDRSIEFIILFSVRAIMAAAFQATYVYTPEIYPTCIRATGLGFCAAFSRFAALLLPSGVNDDIEIAVIVYGFVALFNAGLVFLLPRETARKPLENNVGEVSEVYNDDIFGSHLDLQDMSHLENETQRGSGPPMKTEI